MITIMMMIIIKIIKDRVDETKRPAAEGSSNSLEAKGSHQYRKVTKLMTFSVRGGGGGGGLIPIP